MQHRPSSHLHPRARGCAALGPSVALAIALGMASPVSADQVQLNVALGHSVLKAGDKQVTYLKVGLKGFTLARPADRAPVNLALVIDTSSSMQGEKIAKAREAAIMAIRRLGREDIVSVVEYNSTVRVVVPSTKLTDPDAVCAAIAGLQTRTNTALFAGVSKGAEEVRKFFDAKRVNRVILLSDGLANVGPSSPHELGELGASFLTEGISVTTIGLGDGYNEDLMSRLAQKSDGHHYFAENSADLASVFKNELGDILTAVAQEVTVTIRCDEGVRPIRVLGREAEIVGQEVTACLSQIYSEQEKYLLLEVEVPASAAGATCPVARVEVSYANLQTRTTDLLKSAISARFTDSLELVEKERNKSVLESAVEQLAALTSKMAVQLRDEGKVEEARQLLLQNKAYLESNSKKLDSERLKDYAKTQGDDVKNLDPESYKVRRKQIVEEQTRRATQQSTGGKSESSGAPEKRAER